jgi:uncharacterized membrane protein
MESVDEESQESGEEGVTVSSRFFLLLVLGFVLVFVGIIIVLVAALLSGNSSASVGAVIFIGPFPIVIGAGPDAGLLIVIGVVLAVLSVVVFLVMNRRAGRSGG